MNRVLGTVTTAVALSVGASRATAAIADGTTMKAVRIHAYGGPEVLKYEDAPRPTPAAGEVLVRVHAAAINPIDWKTRDGMLKTLNLPMPFTLGFDVSGVVESVGDGARIYKPGDEVFAYLPIRRGGGYAEFVAVAEKDLARKPTTIDHVHAAAVPLAALTAWQALIDTAGLRDGQTVLIHGGAGGVGHFAIQIAKAKGARVIATASAGNQAFLKELGADQTIDYKTQKFEDTAKEVDVVLDSIGGDTLDRSYQVVKPGGSIVSILQPPDPARCKERNIRGQLIMVRPDGAELAQIAALIDAGKVRPHVSETLSLDQAVKAQELSQSGHTRGKIVLKVK